MMNWYYLILSFIAGGLLGAFFTGGLWWTIQRITLSGRPYLLTIISFILRTAVVLGGFYLIIGLGPYYALISFAGFIITRTIMAYMLKPVQKVKRE